MPVEAIERAVVSLLEIRNVSVSFSGKLDTGETLTGTPTVTEHSTNHLTLSSPNVTEDPVSINGRTVPAGEAVQFVVDASGATEGETYTVDVVCSTSASQTISGSVVMKAVR